MTQIGVIVFASVCLQQLTVDGQRPENSRLNFFDTDLLRYAAEDMRGNVMVSPASVKSVLAMVLEGATGPTATEIRNALRLSPNKEEFREQLNVYLSLLQANTSAAFLQNANGVFVSNKLRLKKEYEVLVRRVYFAEVCHMDFRDPLPSADKINRWVNNATKGLIPGVVEPVTITPETDIILVNALYFKSSWMHPFNARSTRSGCFYVHGVCRNVAMMELHAELNYAYVENLRAHALELPYQREQYSMIVLVPQEREGVNLLIRDLPYMSLPQISALLEPSDVMLLMPRFTVDFGEDLVTPLKSMRINTLFSQQANLSEVFDGDRPHIDSIFHKVHLTVDESGTVAAAASAAMVIPLIENGVQIRVDRPFVFFIRDNAHGLVLFAGKIEEPTAFVDSNGLNGATPRKNSRNVPTKSEY